MFKQIYLDEANVAATILQATDWEELMDLFEWNIHHFSRSRSLCSKLARQARSFINRKS